MSLTAHRPQSLLRIGLRLPIWLYRLKLGWLLGDRFLLLTHTGRTSGLPRQTVIEIVRHDKSSDTCVVASGWGYKSDWVRNIQKTPEVTITLGLRKLPSRAVFLSEEEEAHELFDYAHRHPLAFREISRILNGASVQATLENCQELAKELPVIAFKPHSTG